VIILKSERREFKRVVFNKPIKASIQIATPYIEEAREIIVLDMSAGGLKFASNFEFAVSFITLYKITMELNNKNLFLFGKIIRQRILRGNFFEFSVMFHFDYNHKYSFLINTPIKSDND
jgi:hypothetical protein